MRVAFSTVIRPASLPDRPTPRTSASAPARVIQLAISLLTAPDSTISAISIVASSVTRSPSMKVDFTPARFSIEEICGPPPWTTTGWMPSSFSSTMSEANTLAVSASPIA